MPDIDRRDIAIGDSRHAGLPPSHPFKARVPEEIQIKALRPKLDLGTCQTSAAALMPEMAVSVTTQEWSSGLPFTSCEPGAAEDHCAGRHLSMTIRPRQYCAIILPRCEPAPIGNNPADTLLPLVYRLPAASSAAHDRLWGLPVRRRQQPGTSPAGVARSQRSARESHVTQHIRLPATLLLAACKRDSDSHRGVCDDNRCTPDTRAASH